MNFQNKRLFGIVFAVAILLLIPFIAMRFTDEVKWTPLDFIVAGVLLFGTGFLCEFVMRKVKKLEYRIMVIAVILAALVLIWGELATGFFRRWFAGT